MTDAVVVTAIDRLDGRRRRLAASGDTVAVVSVDVVRELGLSVGDTWDLDDLHAALARTAVPCARSRALRLLTVKDRSSSALLDRLLREGFPEEAAGMAVEGMRDLGFLDDERVARALTSRLRERGYGKARVDAALRKAGLEPGGPADGEGASEDAETERAMRAAASLARRGRSDVHRLASALVRRGFAPSLALASAERVLGPDEPPEGL